MSSNDMGGLPGAGAMNDTLEFVRNMWGAMKIPGISMPSMSPDDINKQITDLKAVESWLQMNMNMLRTTIQTLEVQSATLSAIQTMGQSFSGAGTSRPASDGKPSFESPFDRSFDKPAESSDPSDPSARAPSAMPDPAAFAAQFANPALWWNTVQDQFTQAVNQVVAPAKKSAGRKPAAAKKTPAKKTASAAKKTTASRTRKKSKM
jgi:hypothetical protein